jgi:hypothetical protein
MGDKREDLLGCASFVLPSKWRNRLWARTDTT